MTKRKQDKYPWHKTQRGESFFVPSLDVKATELEGRQMAVILINSGGVICKPGIYQGVLGVMFKRR